LPPLSSGGALSGSTMAPFPHPLSSTARADRSIRLSDKISPLRPRHVVPNPAQTYEPGAAAGRRLRSSHPAVTACPDNVLGLHIVFRGLLSVHSRCGPHTCAVTKTKASAILLPPLLLRLLPASATLPGGACAHWKAPPCHGAHLELSFRNAALTELLRRSGVFHVHCLGPS
jgi:hypothetical protein